MGQSSISLWAFMMILLYFIFIWHNAQLNSFVFDCLTDYLSSMIVFFKINKLFSIAGFPFTVETLPDDNSKKWTPSDIETNVKLSRH